MKQIVIFIVACTLLISCNEKKPKADLENSLSEKNKTLTISVELKTTVEDEFRIMLKEINVDEFQKMDIYASEVIPVTSSYDKITVKFFENTISNKLVIGLGNKHLKSVDIKNISVSYGTNSISVPKEQLSTYFKTNTCAVFDESMNINTKKANGRHVPTLYATLKLINLLKKE